MKKRDWFLIVFALSATWGLDRITKVWASELVATKSYGYLVLSLHHNHGAMLGLFSEIPAILRVVSLATGGAFLLFIFIVIQYMLPIKSMNLRVGLSILIGGILGNVTDRILHGYVIDFLILGNQTLSTAVFNMADALQWVAYFMIVYSLVKESEILWPENERRGRIWVNPKYQWRYSLTLSFAGIGFSIISGVYTYTYLRVTMAEVFGHQQHLIDKYLIPFTLTLVIISLTFAIIMFLIGRKLSHRTAGPLYAFDLFLDDLLKGKVRKLKLRSGDEFPQLEEVAKKLVVKFHKDEIEKNKIRGNAELNETSAQKPAMSEGKVED